MADLRQFFKDSKKNVVKNVSKKLKDANTIKSSVLNPHFRTVIFPQVHKFCFDSVYAELLSQTKFDSLVSLQKVLSLESVMKIHSSSDLTMITPWYKLVADMSVYFLDGKCDSFEEGKLIIPLHFDDKSKTLMAFFVCGGLAHNDQIPS